MGGLRWTVGYSPALNESTAEPHFLKEKQRYPQPAVRFSPDFWMGGCRALAASLSRGYGPASPPRIPLGSRREADSRRRQARKAGRCNGRRIQRKGKVRSSRYGPHRSAPVAHHWASVSLQE